MLADSKASSSAGKKKRGRKSNIMKIGKVKIVKKSKKLEKSAPEPDDEGEYEVILFYR